MPDVSFSTAPSSAAYLAAMKVAEERGWRRRGYCTLSVSDEEVAAYIDGVIARDRALAASGYGLVKGDPPALRTRSVDAGGELLVARWLRRWSIGDDRWHAAWQVRTGLAASAAQRARRLREEAV